tara:strand:- start:529 stop:1401 length:873 start_codon:yes stop_codon:yes gene_type:complete
MDLHSAVPTDGALEELYNRSEDPLLRAQLRMQSREFLRKGGDDVIVPKGDRLRLATADESGKSTNYMELEFDSWRVTDPGTPAERTTVEFSLSPESLQTLRIDPKAHVSVSQIAFRDRLFPIIYKNDAKSQFANPWLVRANETNGAYKNPEKFSGKFFRLWNEARLEKGRLDMQNDPDIFLHPDLTWEDKLVFELRTEDGDHVAVHITTLPTQKERVRRTEVFKTKLGLARGDWDSVPDEFRLAQNKSIGWGRDDPYAGEKDASTAIGAKCIVSFNSWGASAALAPGLDL